MIKMNDDKILTINMRVEGRKEKILTDTGATTEMTEECVKYIKEVDVNEIVEYADGMREKVKKKRLIEIESEEGKKYKSVGISGEWLTGENNTW